MNPLESALKEYFGSVKLAKIQKTRVGIAGLGGLGSNCALHLVRSGFKRLVLCDFDVVEAKNLNRQFYFSDQLKLPKTDALKANLLRINPDLSLILSREKLTGKNTEKIFQDCDAVVEAFDKALYKQMIARAYSRSGKFFVSASGLAGWGKADEIKTRKIHGSFYLIGDLVSEATKKNPPCSQRVSIAAAKQADCILSWVLG